MERRLGGENAVLRKELEDANLDLEDARKSRRDLQVQLNAATTRVGQVNVDCEGLRVCQLLPGSKNGFC